MCSIKVKGMQKLIKHQQNDHLTCRMCPKSKQWVGLSLKHLKMHQNKTHGVKTTEQKCTPCKKKFPDAMAHNVHMLKEHNDKVQCTSCEQTFNNKKSMEDHVSQHHKEKHQGNELSCIVCKYKTKTEAEMTKHYETKHIEKPESNKRTTSVKNNSEIKCKNGHSCKYNKDDRCNFFHEKPSEQPWQKVESKRQRTQQKVQSKSQIQRPQGAGWQDNSRDGDHEKRECTNGPDCKYLRENRCSFSHKKVRSQRQERRSVSRGGAHNQSGFPGQLKPCKFGARCDKGMFCGFLHLPKDFLPAQGRMRH